MITIATFNARHGRPPRGFAANGRLQEAVAGLHADVVGLQEVERHVVRSWFRHQPAAIARAAGMHFVYAPARRLAWTGDDGVALLVRGEIVRSESIVLPAADRAQRRVAIVANIVVGGQALTVATTHLHSGAHRFAERQLDAVVERLWAEPGPHLLLGDLNLEPNRVQPHLDDGWVLAAGDPTFPADDPARRIDHIAGRGLAIDAISVARLAVSDHRVLIARIG